MAYSHTLFLFTLISLTFIASNNAQNPVDLINNICSESLNASFCLEYLKQFYQKDDTLQTLAQKTIQSSAKYVFLVYDEIRVREIQSIKDPALKDIYSKCGGEYTTATNTLNQANDVVKSGDYNKLLSLALNALSQTQSCDKNFVAGGKSQPSDFKSLNQKGQTVCSIVVTLSKRLLSAKV